MKAVLTDCDNVEVKASDEVEGWQYSTVVLVVDVVDGYAHDYCLPFVTRAKTKLIIVTVWNHKYIRLPMLMFSALKEHNVVVTAPEQNQHEMQRDQARNQWMRNISSWRYNNNLEIHGVDELSNENTDKIAIDIFNQILILGRCKYPITMTKFLIQESYRIKRSGQDRNSAQLLSGPDSIIVSLYDYDFKKDIYRNRNRLANYGIRIQEHLSYYHAKLFDEVTNIPMPHFSSFARDGRIILRDMLKGKEYVLSTLEDLYKVARQITKRPREKRPSRTRSQAGCVSLNH